MYNLGLIYLLIYFGLNCEELTLKIRQLVGEQVTVTLSPGGEVPRSQLALLLYPKRSFPDPSHDGPMSDL